MRRFHFCVFCVFCFFFPLFLFSFFSLISFLSPLCAALLPRARTRLGLLARGLGARLGERDRERRRRARVGVERRVPILDVDARVARACARRQPAPAAVCCRGRDGGAAIIRSTKKTT